MLFFRFVEALGLSAVLSRGKGKTPRPHHSQPQEPQLKDLGALTEVLGRQEGMSTFISLLEKYPEALIEVAEGKFPEMTVIAPIDEAFKTNLDLDINNASQMVPFIQYHILQGRVPMADLERYHLTFLPTLLRNSTYTRVTGGQNLAVVHQALDDIVFVTGHHTRSGMVGPIENHDRPLLADIKYHGGLINIIESVLVPPQPLAHTCRVWYKKEIMGFLGALYATGLYDSIAETSDLTIFAPSNTAWQIMAGTVEAMSQEELIEVLRYHIVPGRVLYSVDMQDHDGMNMTTQAGVNVTLRYSRNDHYIDSAQVINADLLFANGVIHVINEVLNPQRPDLQPDFDRLYQLPAFELEGETATGTWLPTPFTTALPCTTECPAATRAHTTRKKGHPITRVAAAPPGVTARPEGVVAAAVGAAAVAAGLL